MGREGGRIEPVRFITCEDDGTDQIVSFALADGETDIKSLILLRTPKYEAKLDDTERGVSVSLENETGDDFDALVLFRIAAKRVTLKTRTSRYDLDVSRVDPAEVSEMKALIACMNFDKRFTIEDV